MESEKFIEYLKNNEIDKIISVPKSDLHNHASNGGNIKFVEKLADIKIELPPLKFESLKAMENWAHEKIKMYCKKVDRYEATFAQAKEDGISILALSVFRVEMEQFGTCGQYIQMFNELKNKYIPDSLFLPELSYFGGLTPDEIDYECMLLDEILSYNYFKSIDLCYDEWSFSEKRYKDYKKIFVKAKKAGLRLRAHAGECGTADDVMRTVEELELDEVQHGIGAISSPQIMKWLAKHMIFTMILNYQKLLLKALHRVDSKFI